MNVLLDEFWQSVQWLLNYFTQKHIFHLHGGTRGKGRGVKSLGFVLWAAWTSISHLAAKKWWADKSNNIATLRATPAAIILQNKVTQRACKCEHDF